MKRVRLGKTDMYVNAIGLGCMGLTHASGLPTPKEEAVEILRKAHDMGYDFYDTAECYTGVNPDGSTAYNEEVVGEAVLNIWVITLNLIVHQKQLENP